MLEAPSNAIKSVTKLSSETSANTKHRGLSPALDVSSLGNICTQMSGAFTRSPGRTHAFLPASPSFPLVPNNHL